MHRLPLRSLTRSTLFLLCLSTPFSSQPTQAADAPAEIPVKPILAADAVQEAFVRVAEKIKLSVVTIYAERAAQKSTSPAAPGAKPDEKPNDGQDGDDDDLPFPFGPRDPDARRTSLGTGMVVSAAGDILTNYHVVKGASVIRVIFDADSERPARPAARLVAFDEESDLAVLRITPRADLPVFRPVEFADSDAVRIGEWALAVGAPFDQAQTVTVGVISAKGRHLDKDNHLSLQDYIQTDASINPGNSGGPLVNLDGQVIGINTAILSPSRFNVGIGFAVPSNTIKQNLPLLAGGKVIARGFLGIQYTALDAEVAREFGVAGGMQIGSLARKGNQFIGPAKEAGLQEGDIITRVNGREVISSDDFRRIVAGSTPGTQLRFAVVRPAADTNEIREITVKLGDWNMQGVTQKEPSPPPVSLPLPAPASRLGIKVADAANLSVDERELFGLEAGAKGLVIMDVAPGSPSDDAELRRGLRIARLRINGGAWQTAASPKEFARLEASLPSSARVLLQVRDRQDVSIYKVVILPIKD
jgi:serine protease Do